MAIFKSVPSLGSVGARAVYRWGDIPGQPPVIQGADMECYQGWVLKKLVSLINLYLLGWGLKRVFCEREKFQHLHNFISNETVLVAILGLGVCMR